MAGGTLYVTNATHTTVLEVRYGTFTQRDGTLVVDTFVMTNACASYIHIGGTLTYGTGAATNVPAFYYRVRLVR